MAKKCQICGKTPLTGHNVSHSKRRTYRRWLPHLREATVAIAGKEKRLTICVRCLRTQFKLAH